VEEGQGAQTKPDFITKYSVAQKEAREARYFLRVFVASGLLTSRQAGALVDEAGQIAAILAKSVVTARRRFNEKRE
jgi:four helix bundle protein